VTDQALEAASWDLEPLVEGRGRAGVEELLAAARERAEAFGVRHRGRVAELDASALASAMRELGEIWDLTGRAGSYAALSFSLDTQDPERGALMQRARELGAAIEAELLFFELEWAVVPDERAAELVEHDELARWRHFLQAARRFRPHLLSEPEEKVITEKTVTGRSAWVRLFTQVTDAITVDVDGTSLTLEEALSRLHHPDRATRHAAGRAVTEALQPGLPVRTFVSTPCSPTTPSTTACASSRHGSPLATWATRSTTAPSRRW
jgi:oligoendopeptidase F